MNKTSLTFSLISCAFLNLAGQYSGFYNVYSNSRVSGNINVNKNVNVRGYVNKTITTIDYGALAAANAQSEANRIQRKRLSIENARYKNEREKQRALMEYNKEVEISKDPLKAFKYGYPQNVTFNDFSIKKGNGLSVLSINGVIPHNSLFTSLDNNTWQNVSESGIRTEFLVYYPMYNELNVWVRKESPGHNETVGRLYEYWVSHEKPKRKNYSNKIDYKYDKKRYQEVCDSLDKARVQKVYPDFFKSISWVPGHLVADADGDSVFVHQNTTSKRRVWGIEGYCNTLIWEDEYEYCITDNYFALLQGVVYSFKVRYKCDKNVTLDFEDLEGRRFYLKPLLDKVVATMKATNLKTIQRDDDYPKRRNYKNIASFNKAVDNWLKLK